MSRFGGVFWFVLVIASGMTNFLVKQNVQSLDDKLTHVRRQTIDEQKKIHDLTADWTYLNQPELLADLNNRYVHLAPVAPKQVTRNIDEIPLRPAPPAPTAAPLIADATAAPIAPVPVAPLAPIVPVSAIMPARPAAEPAAAPTPARIQPAPAPVRTQPVPVVRSASLDGLFAQVTGDR